MRNLPACFKGSEGARESKVVQMGMSDMALDKLEEIKADLGAGQRQDLRSFADVIDFDEASSSDPPFGQLLRVNRYAVPVVEADENSSGRQAFVVKFIRLQRIRRKLSLSLLAGLLTVFVLIPNNSIGKQTITPFERHDFVLDGFVKNSEELSQGHSVAMKLLY